MTPPRGFARLPVELTRRALRLKELRRSLMRGCRLGHGAPRTSGRRTRRLGWRCGHLGPIVLASFVAAAPPPQNPVYIDDSPRAWEQFQSAQDQAPDNAGEAVRLYQELLD